jgi:hypothetical protein
MRDDDFERDGGWAFFTATRSEVHKLGFAWNAGWHKVQIGGVAGENDGAEQRLLERALCAEESSSAQSVSIEEATDTLLLAQVTSQSCLLQIVAYARMTL